MSSTVTWWVLAVAATLPSTLAAQQRSLPPVLVSGLAAYRTHGPEAALRAWLAGSPVADNTESVREMVRGLNEIQEALGDFDGYDVVHQRSIGSRVLRSYLILHYKRGPLYAYIDTYQVTDGRIVTSFQFNTKVEAIFPSSLWEQ